MAANGLPQIRDEGVDTGVSPGPDGIDRRVLPGLKAIAMSQVMDGLPVVEDFIAVLDRMINRTNHVCSEKKIGQ